MTLSRTLIALCLFASPFLRAEEAKLLVTQPTTLVAEPDFKHALPAEWKIAKGTWQPQDGVLTATEVPADKHVAVLWHQVGLQSACIECDFRMDGSPVFIVGCDGAKHVGRVVINAKKMDIAEDSPSLQAKAASHVIASLPLTVKSKEWHHLRVEWQGDRIAARLDGQELQAQHPYLATKKARSWFAVQGTSTQLRNLSIRSAAPKAP